MYWKLAGWPELWHCSDELWHYSARFMALFGGFMALFNTHRRARHRPAVHTTARAGELPWPLR
jgi:hypothetical protein